MRSPILRIHDDEIIVDNFAGGGGASLGIETALGRAPDIAINHDREALAMHERNHPTTRHLRSDVWEVDPKAVCAGRRVGLAWFSPDCTHHSKAKGGKPRERKSASKSRALAWVVVRWARAVKPRVIILENVEEFADWGPLGADGRPDKLRKGLTFRIWMGKLVAAGYRVEMRELRAHDYGAPTIRKRLFIIARSDGQPIVWPEPTHGPGRAQPHRVAAECIQWELPCPSIFERRRELAEKTLRRIARGVMRYVVEAAEPFVVPLTHGRQNDSAPHSVMQPLRTITGAHRGEIALVSPTLVQTGYGERPGQAPRCMDAQKPLGTIIAGGTNGCGNGKHALVLAYLAKHNGGHEATGSPLSGPLHTITTQDHHSLVRVTLGGSLERIDGGSETGLRGGAGGEIGRFDLEAEESERDAEQWPAARRDDVEGWLSHGDRVDRRSAVSGVGASDRVDSPARTDPDWDGSESHRWGQDEQRPIESGSRDAQCEHHARLSHRAASDYGHSGGRIDRGEATAGIRSVVLHNREGTGRVANDCVLCRAARVASFLRTLGPRSAQLSLTTDRRFGLVYVHGEPYAIADIGMRMLAPRELFRAQGFPDAYEIAPAVDGKPMTKTAQIRMCGNSVCPPIAAALVSANLAREEVVAA